MVNTEGPPGIAEEALVNTERPLVIDEEALVNTERPLVIDEETLVNTERPLVIAEEALVNTERPLVIDEETLVNTSEALCGWKQASSQRQRPVYRLFELYSLARGEMEMTHAHTSIAEQLNRAQLAISNTLGDAEIQALVADLGYPIEMMSEGWKLYQAAVLAVNAQHAAAGAQQEATQLHNEAREVARDAYQALAKLARAIFIDDKAQLEALGLRGTLPKSTAGFIAAAMTLFENARGIPDLVDYGYDFERLAAEQAKIAAYVEADNRQEAAKGTAQQATREQDAALLALNEWVKQYIKIARIALREKAQLLEKIGVPVRTRKSRAQSAATEETTETQAEKEAE